MEPVNIHIVRHPAFCLEPIVDKLPLTRTFYNHLFYRHHAEDGNIGDIVRAHGDCFPTRRREADTWAVKEIFTFPERRSPVANIKGDGFLMLVLVDSAERILGPRESYDLRRNRYTLASPFFDHHGEPTQPPPYFKCRQCRRTPAQEPNCQHTGTCYCYRDVIFAG